MTLGINRSDYMLHDVPYDDRSILQVEINTIASSFGSLSTKISQMFRTLYKSDSIPVNNALPSIAATLATGHNIFTTQVGSSNAIIIMIVQPNEGKLIGSKFYYCYHLYYYIALIIILCRKLC